MADILYRSRKTAYNHILFRSRLEARWAVFFDYLGIRYEYEPEWDAVDVGPGLMYYKPDFYLPDQELWVEIKPFGITELTFGANAKLHGWAREYGGILLLVGIPSVPKANSKRHYLVSYYDKKDIFLLQNSMWWCRCPKCGKISIEEMGGIPRECENACILPSEDLFGEELPDVDGHLDKKIKHACRAAKSHKFSGPEVAQ